MKQIVDHTYEKTSRKKITFCECLDFVEASLWRRIYPLMYCHMELEGHLDIERLKHSVYLSGKIVPEIMYAYNFEKGYFINLGHTTDDIVISHAAEPASFLRQDLSRHPQLRIIIVQKQKHDNVVIVMSHILTDGKGFLQYLYLLSSIYNNGRVNMNMKNKRDIAPFLADIRVLAPTEQTRHNRHATVSPLRSSGKNLSFFCLTAQIPAGSMTIIHQKAKQCGVTLNDIFITAYARVIARLQNIDTVVIPCPADLRQFFPELQKLTIANMTGLYRDIVVELSHNCTFASTLQQVHIEISLQKSRYRCFSGIMALHKTFHRIPHSILKQTIKAAYRIRPISYTNIGVISDTKLQFSDCTIQNCFFTGTYRLPPDIQLTVSTFNHVCTLNCTMLGSPDDIKHGQYILDQVKYEILEWIESN